MARRWPALLDAAALRHLLTHANGIVDEQYSTAVPASRLKLGQRVHVGRAEANATGFRHLGLDGRFPFW
jgi:hypothetical protein